MRNRNGRISLHQIALFIGLAVVVGCIGKPPVIEPDDEVVIDRMSCGHDGKEWIVKSPFFNNDQVFEAKGLAPASPNPQTQRDNAIDNAMNTLSRLYDSDVKSYSEQFVSEYRNWFRNPDEAQSAVLYDQLRTILNDNRLKWLKMDECRDRLTGEWWVFLYTSKPNLEAAEREASLEFENYMMDDRKEQFRGKMNQQQSEFQQKGTEILESLPD